MSRRRLGSLVTCAVVSLSTLPLDAHEGPPFPIVSDRRAGAYTLSIWTDPDTTDDGSAGGQFWIVISTDRGAVPAGTRATVTAAPIERSGAPQAAIAAPVRGDAANQYAGLVLDHEGRFRVRVAIDGPLGPAAIDAEVTATYNLRPPPIVILLSVAPFVLVGLLWAKLLNRRRRASSYTAPLPGQAEPR